MMFRGGSLPQPISDDSAVALIVNQLGLGLKQYQDTKRVMMLNNPLQYLKSRNAAYTTIAASAGDVYHGALYQIAQSVTEGVPATEDIMVARANVISANTDVVAAALTAWPTQIQSADRLLWGRGLLLRQP